MSKKNSNRRCGIVLSRVALRCRKWLIEQNSGHSLMTIPQENDRGLVLGSLLQPVLSWGACNYHYGFSDLKVPKSKK